MRKHKIPIEKVQEAFNSAIKRRDCRCMVKDFEPCSRQLEASHFFSVGSSPSLRFYPPNCYAQCSVHHWRHHNSRDWTDKYELWMSDNHKEELEKMHFIRHLLLKYTDELKAEIIRLCNEDKLDELKELIEKELGLSD